MSRNLLITGIPATGKTTIGDYLAREHGFAHIDMEADNFKNTIDLVRDADTFFTRFPDSDTVITWGFDPYDMRLFVQRFVNSGFKLFWLDGDRAAALRNFLVRESKKPQSELTYYRQMSSILASGIIEKLGPIIISPFTPEGELASTKATAKKLLDAV
jgi:hypothetical protein